jgi:hypothetical protein
VGGVSISVLGQPVPRAVIWAMPAGDTEDMARSSSDRVGRNDVGDENGTGELGGVEALAHEGDARGQFEDHAEGRALAISAKA